MANKKQPNQRFNKSRDNFFQKAVNKDTNLKPSTRSTDSNDFFVRPSSSKPSTDGKKEKKAFDKSKWRMEKYSKKHKLENWEERRKKAIVRVYNKERKQETRKYDVNKIYDEEEKRSREESPTAENENEETKKRKKVFKKPHEQYLDKKEEKKRKREEFLKARAEKEEARKNSKMKKLEKFKKLNRKTRRGQPIMKERIEYLLEKIQKSVDV